MYLDNICIFSKTEMSMLPNLFFFFENSICMNYNYSFLNQNIWSIIIIASAIVVHRDCHK